MNLEDYIVDASGTLLDAAQAIANNKSRCAMVVDEDKVIGVLSEGDLVRALLRGTEITALMRNFVHHGFIHLKERDYVKALELFRLHGISLIPIVDQNLRLKEVITLQDMLAHAIIKPDR